MFVGPLSGVPDAIRCGEESLLSQIIVVPTGIVTSFGVTGL
jgi:hypothetical protein